jgi:hypothetical protein
MLSFGVLAPPARDIAPSRMVRNAPAVAFALALLLRLPFVSAGLFHHDEVELARAVEGSFERHAVLPSVAGRYGSVLLALAPYVPYHLATGRRAEAIVLLVGIFAGALLVAGMVLLVQELDPDPLAGWLAGAFTFGGTLFLTTSATGKESAPMTALATLATWLAARAARLDAWGLRLVAAAVFGFALSVHEAGALLVLPVAFAVVAIELRHGRGWRAIALDLGAGAVAIATPLWLAIWNQLVMNATEHGLYSAHFAGLISLSLPVAMRELVPSFGLAVLAFGAVGLVAAVVRRRACATWTLAPWLLVFFYVGNATNYTPRALLYLLPPLVAFAGSGAALLARRASTRYSHAVAAALAVLACAPGIARAYPILAARAASSGPKEMALLVAARTRPGDVVLCQDDAPFLEYYAPGRVLLKQPLGDPAGTARLVREARFRAEGGAAIYVGGYAFTYDIVGQLGELLRAQFEPVPVGVVTNEWFYRSDLEPARFEDVLYQLVPR